MKCIREVRGADGSVADVVRVSNCYPAPTSMSFNVGVKHWKDTTSLIKSLSEEGWRLDKKGMEKDDTYGEFKWLLKRSVNASDRTISLYLSASVPDESDTSDGITCRKVQVDTISEMVETPVYKIVCNGEEVGQEVENG